MKKSKKLVWAVWSDNGLEYDDHDLHIRVLYTRRPDAQKHADALKKLEGVSSSYTFEVSGIWVYQTFSKKNINI